MSTITRNQKGNLIAIWAGGAVAAITLAIMLRPAPTLATPKTTDAPAITLELPITTPAITQPRVTAVPPRPTPLVAPPAAQPPAAARAVVAPAVNDTTTDAPLPPTTQPIAQSPAVCVYECTPTP